MPPVSARFTHRPPAPPLRTAVLASAAALGAVTTGTFTAVLPAATEVAPVADVSPTSAEQVLSAQLSSADTALVRKTVPSSPRLVPIAHTTSVEPTDTDPHVEALDKAGRLADELAALHAEQERLAAEEARLDALIAEGGLDGWIAEALRIVDLPQSYAPGVKNIVMAESNGNPRAINDWDSNAVRGTPSEGLMQTIPSTFRAYVHPSMAGRSITDPVANLTAGIRYMVATYGSDTLAAGGRTNSSGAYIGY